MVSYFVPISLLVLAGFTLGLLVGRLAWVSSKSTTDREPEKQEALDDPEEEAPTVPHSAFPRSTQDLPIWQMREVPAPERSTSVEPSSVEVDLDYPPDGYLDAPRPRHAEIESAERV